MKTVKLIGLTLALSFLTSNVFAAGDKIFYPDAPAEPRIQFLTSINGSAFFGVDNPYGDRFPGYVPENSRDKNPIVKPYGLATHDGNIFVVDSGRKQVMVFDMKSKKASTFGNVKPGVLNKPIAIAVGPDGTRYVTDTRIRKVMVYGNDGKFKAGYGDAKAMKPTDVSYWNGRLYVLDIENSQVVVMDAKTGAEIKRFSRPGSADGQIYKANSLTQDKDGNVYVSDTVNGRIMKFSSEGTYLSKVGALGDGVGKFVRPKGVAVDRENRLYAVDAAFENVQIFNDKARLLMYFGEVGNVPGGVNLPAKIAIDYDIAKYFKGDVAQGQDLEYVILVSSLYGDNKVNVYGFLKK